MVKEVTLKREDGSRVLIRVSLTIDYSIHRWGVSVLYCGPKKRTFRGVVDTNGYEYRRRQFPEGRTEYVKEKNLEYVTEDEIRAVKVNLINDLLQSI